VENDNRINVRTDEGLKKKFKRICVEQGVSMADIVNDLVGEWVEENEIK